VIIATQRQLIQQRAELAERNQELDAFAGRVAHDLRGPLGTLSLSVSLLAERAPGERKTLTVMRNGIEGMSSLVDDLLNLSRVGAMPGAVADTSALAQTLEGELETLVTANGGSLRIDFQDALLACHPGLLHQALWNLGENAFKYRRHDVPLEVVIVGRREDSRYTLRVSDNGEGMTSEDARQAFQPFFRGAHTRSVPGTGLGLSIVRRIVDVCGGTVSIHSELGQGTTFRLEFPVAPPA
jgi:signal transduction histidine kinase